jgi:glycosyltransferase involved in cell wall biosynthesis
MRILIIDFHFFFYSIQLANALSESDEVILMLPDSIPDYCNPMINERVKVIYFHKPRIRYPSNIKMVRSIFKTIAEIKPDVVHQMAWNLWMNLALPIFPDVPLVVTIHDADRHPGDDLTPLNSWGWRWPDQVIVHAEVIKSCLQEKHHVSGDKINVIPLGQFDLFKTWSSDNVVEQDHTILFFGRIRDYKGLQYLIQAEPKITSQVPDVRIVIAGEGEDFEKYEQIMVHKERFTVHNYYIPDEMVARLFQEASVVVLPYIEASQSAVITTAYAFGKPVVATPVGGIPEAVKQGETGYLVPPGDSDSLADAVIKLLQNTDLRREMGRKALEKAQSDLSWQEIAHKIQAVYRQTQAAHSRKTSQ